MPNAHATPVDVSLFLQASLAALIRAEGAGRVPPRFTGTGPEVWAAFRNELTATDLAALVIQDAGVSMPVPFAPDQLWPGPAPSPSSGQALSRAEGWPEWGILRQPLVEVQTRINAALALAEQPRDAYLRGQARPLGIELPPDESLAKLRLPLRHERWLELPSTAGWVAYTLCTRPGAELYFWDNAAIVCATPAEMLFAGLVAWELGAPPNTELHIWLDEEDLTATLKAGETYHEVVGLRSRHAHRDLRILHREGKPPLWI